MRQTTKIRIIVLFVLVSMILFSTYKFVSQQIPHTVYVVPSYTHVTAVASPSPLLETYQTLVKKENIADGVVKIAKEMFLTRGPLYFTMLNGPYLRLTYSWLCNTKHMGIHKQVFLVTTDKSSYSKLKKDWPEVTVVLLESNEFIGDQEYSQVGYIRLIVKRTLVLLSLVMSDIEFCLFETDAIWLSNAAEEIRGILRQDVDMLVNPVSSTIYNGGLFCVVPNRRSKLFWLKLSQMMATLKDKYKSSSEGKLISEEDNDQKYMSALILQR